MIKEGLDKVELITLVRGIKMLRVQMSAKEQPALDDLERYHNLVDCLVHLLFSKFGERKQTRSTWIPIYNSGDYSVQELNVMGVPMFAVVKEGKPLQTFFSLNAAISCINNLNTGGN